MIVVLTEQCEALTGSLGRDMGYYLRSTKKGRFFSQRSRHRVPPDGHWRMILTCAQMAQSRLYIAEISVKRQELAEALWEAGHWIAAQNLRLGIYHAKDILNLKTTFGL